MARSASWVWLTLGTTVALAASCSSSDAKKTPNGVMPDIGGEAAGGASGHAGGGVVDEGGASATPSSSGAATGGEGDGATSMTDGWLSGTRLRAVLDVAGDAKRFKRWHDTELDVDCEFAPDADGVERCLPTSENGSARYSDAKCTKPVALFGADDTIPAFALEPYHVLDCGTGPSYLEVGKDAAGVTDLYGFSNGDCVADGTVAATQIVKQLGAVVPASKFAATTKTVREARDSQLSTNVRVAEDGSREVINQFDLVREVDCKPGLREPDGYACVPQNLAFIEVYFADDKCKVPVAYHPPCQAEPTIILDSSPHSTGQYFELGAKVATPGFKNYSVTCQADPSPPEPGAGYYAIGKEAPWLSFPQLSSKNEGKGRIVLNVLRGEDAELVARQAFVDTDLNVECSPGQAADLKTHCIPRTLWTVNAFADAKCSSAVFENKAGDALPDGLEFLEGNALGGGTAVFKIGAKVAVPAKLWQMSGLGCEERGVTADVDHYATKSVTPAEMALITREVE